MGLTIQFKGILLWIVVGIWTYAGSIYGWWNLTLETLKALAGFAIIVFFLRTVFAWENKKVRVPVDPLNDMKQMQKNKIEKGAKDNEQGKQKS